MLFDPARCSESVSFLVRGSLALQQRYIQQHSLALTLGRNISTVQKRNRTSRALALLHMLYTPRDKVTIPHHSKHHALDLWLIVCLIAPFRPWRERARYNYGNN
jgi:hypothetical protein